MNGCHQNESSNTDKNINIIHMTPVHHITMLLSAVWTLILTAPIHCKFLQICSDKASEVMLNISKSVLMKNKLILDGLRMSTFSFLDEVLLQRLQLILHKISNKISNWYLNCCIYNIIAFV